MNPRREKIKKLEYQLRKYCIQIVGILKSKNREKGERESVNEIIQEHDPKRKTWGILCPTHIYINTLTPMHIIMKSQNTWDKNKIL